MLKLPHPWELGPLAARCCLRETVRLYAVQESALIDLELGVFYSSEGNHTRPESLRWPSSPDTLGEA